MYFPLFSFKSLSLYKSIGPNEIIKSIPYLQCNSLHLILFHLFRLNFERFVNIFTKFLMVVQINLEIKYEHQRTTLKTLQISNYMNARKKSRIQIGYNGSASKKCWKEQMDEKCTQKWSEQQLTSFHYYLSVVVSLCEIITSLLTMNANVWPSWVWIETICDKILYRITQQKGGVVPTKWSRLESTQVSVQKENPNIIVCCRKLCVIASFLYDISSRSSTL